MKKLTTVLARRPVTVIMIMAAVCIAAVFAFIVLPLDRLPELTTPRVTVETMYPGMAADDMRSLVTIPVEDAFSSVKGLERMQSVSRDSSSLVNLDFRWGTDTMAASALVREAVDAVYPALPFGVLKPVISPGDHGLQAHAIIAVRSLTGDESFARRLADYDIRAKLRRIDGAGSVLLVGGEKNEGQLLLDVPRLAALGLSPPEFVKLLSNETTDIPAGNAREGTVELVVVSSGRPEKIEDLADLVLPAPSTSGDQSMPLYVNDAADIGIKAGRKDSVFVYNGKEVTALEIYRRPGADPVRLSRDIRKAIAELNSQFGHNAEISLIKDAGPSIVGSMSSLAVSAFLAVVVVIAVLLFFIRRIRTGLLAAFSIPFSMAAGICVLALSGRTFNSMSLGGLALGIGMVSDLAVIMLDLLNRNFDNVSEKPSAEKTGEKAASIAGSSLASTLTTVIVFAPVIFLPGPLGSLFGDTAIALVSSIFAGWIYAQFFVPSLYRFTFSAVSVGKKDFLHGSNFTSGKNKFIEEKYRKALAPVLKNPGKWFAVAGALCLAGALVLKSRPAVFVSPNAAEEILISMDFPPGTVPENIGSYGAAFSGFISELPFMKGVYGMAGAEIGDAYRRADLDFRPEELVIHCLPKKGIKPEKILPALRDKAKEIMREKLPDSMPDSFSVHLPRDVTESLLGLSSVLTYAVRGKDREEGKERVNTIEQKIAGTDIAGTVRVRPLGTRPELRMYPNREALAYFGISASHMAETLYVINEGVIAANLEINGQPLDVRVSGNPGSWNVSNDSFLEEIPVKTAFGKSVFLGSLGRIERREADAVLARADRSDVIFMDFPQNKLSSKSTQKLADLFPWFFRADESVFHRYRISLLLTIILALVLIYMTMGAQFESFLLPLVLMLTIPFSLAGAGAALLLFNSNLDSGAALGLCALFGLVVNNGLILFEISEERIRMGCSPVQAVYGGASIRLRPVLITTLTTVFALLPVALNPLGSAQKSMAAAMLGGLAVSTCLSLFLLPPVFIRFFAWRGKN